jgi:CAAX protease family protein
VTSSYGTASTSMDPSIQQYSLRTVLAVWAAAALPMGALAWLVAPALAGPAPSASSFAQALIGGLYAGLVWQLLLVVILVAREQRTLRWSIVRDALWLRPPSSGSRCGGLMWLWGVLPFVAGFFALQLAPLHVPTVASHDFGCVPAFGLRQSNTARQLEAVRCHRRDVRVQYRTGRGIALSRPAPAPDADCFWRRGLDRQWTTFRRLPPAPTLVDSGEYVAGLLFAYPSRWFRSAWLSILIHSTQSVYLLALLLVLVLR